MLYLNYFYHTQINTFLIQLVAYQIVSIWAPFHLLATSKLNIFIYFILPEHAQAISRKINVPKSGFYGFGLFEDVAAN